MMNNDFINYWYEEPNSVNPIVFAPIFGMQDTLVVSPLALKDFEADLRNAMFDNFAGEYTYVSTTKYKKYLLIGIFIKSDITDKGRSGVHLGIGVAIQLHAFKRLWCENWFANIINAFHTVIPLDSLFSQKADTAIQWFNSRGINEEEKKNFSQFIDDCSSICYPIHRSGFMLKLISYNSIDARRYCFMGI